MATTQKTAAPAKKSTGFQGIKAAFWIIVVCFILAVCFFQFFLGNSDHIAENGEVIDGNIWGTIYKGGVVVPVILTLLFTVIALSIERWLALNTAFGKGKLPKFVANIKAALNANDFVKAQQLCDAQRGTVANVVGASLKAYKDMEATSGILTSWVAVVAYNYYTNKIDKLTFALDEVGYSIAQTYEANHAEEA